MAKDKGDGAVILGAVASEPGAVLAWDAVREHFRELGIALDVVLYTSYERQSEALLQGHIDAALSSPLAHARIERRSGGRSGTIAMRDTDRDARSRLVARRDTGVKEPKDLAGKTLAVGAKDAVAARLLPLHFLKEAGTDFGSVRVLPFEGDPGKHGDTGVSEQDALAAVLYGRADAAVVSDALLEAEVKAGRVDLAKVEPVWASPPFDLKVIDARQGLVSEKADALRRGLFGLKWESAQKRRALTLLGAKAWVPPRDEGYAALKVALEREGAW